VARSTLRESVSCVVFAGALGFQRGRFQCGSERGTVDQVPVIRILVGGQIRFQEPIAAAQI
jgi:hypothetical protein